MFKTIAFTLSLFGVLHPCLCGEEQETTAQKGYTRLQQELMEKIQRTAKLHADNDYCPSDHPGYKVWVEDKDIIFLE